MRRKQNQSDFSLVYFGALSMGWETSLSCFFDTANRADGHTARSAFYSLALVTGAGIDHVYVALTDRRLGAFGKTESTGSALVSDFHCH
jgi:hypothetical protein